MADPLKANPHTLITTLAEELKKEKDISAPEWAAFVRTGTHKERVPVKEDWWYTRAASVLRRVYKEGPIGVEKLRYHYGGAKNRGMRPQKFFKGAGNNLRKILQQLEKAGLVKQAQVKAHKGRVVTPKGHKLLVSVAKEK